MGLKVYIDNSFYLKNKNIKVYSLYAFDAEE